MRTKSTMLSLLFLFIGTFAFAQEMQVSGTVTSSEDGLTMPGVSIVVVGTTNGTSTDFDGNFSMKVNEGDKLQFNFMGYSDKTITASSTMNIVMDPDASVLSEVIVIGYGTATKESFTGSAVTVDSEKLLSKNTSNVTQALAGETAGVTVINTSGQPGSVSDVRIRGYGSVNGNRDPLYVVDGVPFSGNINSINPSDIASTTILKDASATAIYGSRGANGVILITTKKGKSGKSQIDVDFNYGTNVRQLPMYDRITNQEEYVETAWDGLQNYYMADNGLDYSNPADLATASQWASDNIYGSASGIAEHYNIWDKPGAQLIDPATGKFVNGVNRTFTPESWDDALFSSSQRVEGNIRMSGGVENTTYSTSFGVLNDDGYYLNSDYSRYTARADIGHQVKDWLMGSMNIGYTYSESNQLGQSSDSNSGFWFADNIPTIYPVYLRTDNKGTFAVDPVFGGKQFDYGDNQTDGNKRAFGALTNAAGNMTYDTNKTINQEINGNTYLEATFLKDFKAFARLGMQYVNSNNNQRDNPFYGGSATQGGSIYKVNTSRFILNFMQGISYTKQIEDHSFAVSIFHETNKYDYSRNTTYKTNLVDPFGLENNNAVVTQSANSYMIQNRIESFFGKVDYDFEKKYYASGTIRRDGSSRFKNNKWGTFGSVGLGWIMSKESFMENLDWVKFMKIKTSYGVVGDQAGANSYSGFDLFSISNLNDEPTFSFETKGNPDLTWETSTMFQIGAEFSLTEYFDAELDYYIKDTEDLFFDRRVGPSIGYALIKVNDGALRNSGFEFNLTGHLVNTNDFKLDLIINGEILNNELTRMPIDPATGKEKNLDISGVYGRSVGHSLFDFYMREYTGVDAQLGTSTWKLYYDDKNDNNAVDPGEGIKSYTDYMYENKDVNVKETTTDTYSDATQKYVGKSAIPDLRGAFRLHADYKGFSLSTQFLYQFGGYAVDYGYRNLMDNGLAGDNLWHTDMRNRWQKPGDVTDIPRLSSEADNNVNSTSTRFLTSTDFVSLNNARLGYEFPKSITDKMGVAKLSLFVTGDNLWLSSKRDGFNPMTSETGSSDTYRYQPLTTYSGGVRVSF